jgi:tetratricopeptide (TPR) repeat protein
MSYGPELDRLAARWADQPTSTCFASLAEGLRKSGALQEAGAVAVRGVALRPEYLPGHLVLARIYRDQEDWPAARAELRAALHIDAEHPVVRDALEQLSQRSGFALVAPVTQPMAQAAPVAESADADGEAADIDGEAADLVYGDEHGARSAPDELMFTESLAMLYWGQGHHEQAVEVFEALIRRNPANTDLVVRRDAVRAEFDALRPAPFDAAHSGGRGVRDWLASVAAVTTPPPRPLSGFDAFYQTSAAPSSKPGDLAAFQAWLRELDR